MVKPSEVGARAQKLEEQNYRFRTFLKNRANPDELDAKFMELHRGLFADYDCCKCANCCKSYSIMLDTDEVMRIAAFLGLSQNDFASEYLMDSGESDEKPYELKEKPCRFLCEDGRCLIQDCKPDDCMAYPFTDQPDRLASMFSIIEHAEACPIVFEILERLKDMYRFRNRV